MHQRIEGHDLSALPTILHDYAISEIIVSSTATVTTHMRNAIQQLSSRPVVYLSHETPIPLTNAYATPATLGPDRLAAAIASHFIAEARFGQRVATLTIDLGTAITYDLTTADGIYLGGNISPGMEMRFKALHEFTDKLPRVQSEGQHPFVGNSTETAIRCGVIDGIRHEIQGFIHQISEKYTDFAVFLTGGDYLDFEEPTKKRIFAEPFLVHQGLHLILQHITKQ